MGETFLGQLSNPYFVQPYKKTYTYGHKLETGANLELFSRTLFQKTWSVPPFSENYLFQGVVAPSARISAQTTEIASLVIYVAQLRAVESASTVWVSATRSFCFQTDITFIFSSKYKCK